MNKITGDISHLEICFHAIAPVLPGQPAVMKINSKIIYTSNACSIIINKNRTGVCQIINLEKIVPTIVAIEPCYGKDGGNTTRIYTRNGEIFEDNRRLQTVLKNIARHFGADLAALRETYGKLLGCDQNIPLSLSLNLVLVPLKMRKPQFEQDGATGYVSASAVTAITTTEKGEAPETARCLIHLTGGLTVPGLYSKRNTEKRLINGRLALSHYAALHGHKKNGGASLVMERASDDALDRVATFSRIVYEMLVDR